jgi:hypothetical protein
MLTAAYFMLRDGVEYRDLGGRYFTDRDRQETTKLSDPPAEGPWRRRGGQSRMTSKSITGPNLRVSR